MAAIPGLFRVQRTFRRLAYVETPFVATSGDEPVVDTSHIPDDAYDDVMEARAERVLDRHSSPDRESGSRSARWMIAGFISGGGR